MRTIWLSSSYQVYLSSGAVNFRMLHFRQSPRRVRIVPRDGDKSSVQLALNMVTIEDLNTKAARGLDKALFAKLATGDWITRRQDLLITGKTGTGKSWLACALAHKACRDDRSVLYYRVPRLLDALALARGDGRYVRLLKTLARVQLLILDDWGLAPLTSQQGRDLLEIVDDRHGRSSTIVTSQLPVDHWHEVIVDPTIADAVLDRLVHTAHRLTLDGETLRKPPEKSAKRGKLDTDAAE